jgi:hypothetical protein
MSWRSYSAATPAISIRLRAINSGAEQPRLLLNEPRLPRIDALTPLLLILTPALPPIRTLGGETRKP